MAHSTMVAGDMETTTVVTATAQTTTTAMAQVRTVDQSKTLCIFAKNLDVFRYSEALRHQIMTF